MARLRRQGLTPAYLSSLVREGEARYFLLGGQTTFGPGGSANAGASLVESACTPVSGFTALFDCAGKAAAIAAALR